MIIHKVKRLLKTKYNGSKVIISKFDDNDSIDILIKVPEEYLQNTDQIKQEVFELTGTEFINIIPIVEV